MEKTANCSPMRPTKTKSCSQIGEYRTLKRESTSVTNRIIQGHVCPDLGESERSSVLSHVRVLLYLGGVWGLADQERRGVQSALIHALQAADLDPTEDKVT